MTKIIAHRGASGTALENSFAAIRKALAADVDAIEFDIHLTRDRQVVVIHDSHTARVADTTVHIRDLTLKELQKLSLKNGQTIPTLDEVLDIVGEKPIFIDIKDDGSAAPLLAVLSRHSRAHVTCVSFRHGELAALRATRPEIPTYVLEHLRPFDIIQNARGLHATGIGLNAWLMNPLTYFLARRHGLALYVYTVNSRLLARFLTKFYPGVAICSDYPERLAWLRGRDAKAEEQR